MKKLKMSESYAGYLMVLPAIVIICAVALWPVVRSFWYSMFDLRLNHPAKSAVYLSYKLDMEKYVDTRFYVEGTLKELKENTAGHKGVEAAAVEQQLSTLHNQLMQSEAIASRYEPVKQLLDDFKPVSDATLRYVDLSREKARLYLNTIAEVTERLQALSTAENDAADQAVELMEEFRLSIMQPNFIGFGNYRYYLEELKVHNGKPGRLGMALLNTFYFTISSVFLELVLGLAIALLINKSFRGRGLVRAAILVPWAIPTAVSALMWKFLYDGQTGVVAKFCDMIGLVENPGILLTTRMGSMLSIIFADVWKTTPYMALLLLAGLQTIPVQLYEVGQVDGATKLQRFFKITLPLLKPTILVALLFRTLDAFRVFDLVFVLTGGGPANATETISVYAYKTMFAQMNFGRGATLSIVVFICITLISIGYVKILGADVLKDQAE